MPDFQAYHPVWLRSNFKYVKLSLLIQDRSLDKLFSCLCSFMVLFAFCFISDKCGILLWLSNRIWSKLPRCQQIILWCFPKCQKKTFRYSLRNWVILIYSLCSFFNLKAQLRGARQTGSYVFCLSPSCTVYSFHRNTPHLVEYSSVDPRSWKSIP